MKFIIVLFALAAVCAAAPTEEIAIVRQSSDSDVDGSFKYGYESADGTSVDAAGNADGVQGRFTFTSPEGEKFEVTYTANAEGFQPQGAHFPVGPETPAHVLRTIEWNKAHPEEDTEAH